MSREAEGRRVEGCRLSLGDDAALSAREKVDAGQAVAIRFDANKRAAIQVAPALRHEVMAGRDLAYGQSTLDRQ